MRSPDQAAERRHRGWILGAAFAAVFLLLLGRLFWLQIVHGQAYAEMAQRNLIRPDPIPALRGALVDREGRLVAGNRVSCDLALEVGHPAYRRAADIRAAVEEVAATLGVAPEPLVERALNHRQFFAPVILAEDLQTEQLGPLFERLYPIPGLRVDRVPCRWYPYGGVASHLLGYVGKVRVEELGAEGTDSAYCAGSWIGRAGAERRYEGLLRGHYGSTYVTVDAVGRKTDLFPNIPPRAPVAGNDLVLTLDLDLQRLADSLLAAASGERGAGTPVAGAVVALDPRTGEILVSASAPGYDPNRFVGGLAGDEWASLQDGAHPLLNRTVQASYPPGSLFKIVTTLAGLDAGWLGEGTRFSPCFGSYRFGNRAFQCWKPEGHGSLDLRGAFANSCDVYYYQIGRRLGLARFLDFMATLDLDVPTGIDLPEEETGLVPTLAWYRRRLGESPAEGNVLNLSIGQGELLLTPIAMAAFVGALVTDGWVLEPRIALRAERPDGGVVWDAGEPRRLRKLPVSEAHRELLRDLMEEAVARGTGSRARVEGIRVGGKTGTAQNPHGGDHALFVGFAPVSAPRIVVVVVIERGGHGGVVAAPIAQRLIEALLVEPPPAPVASVVAIAAEPDADAESETAAESPATVEPESGAPASQDGSRP
ncbi:MAG: penicillin-binding protein 2 [Candidatus Eisenbacteria bacterium]